MSEKATLRNLTLGAKKQFQTKKVAIKDEAGTEHEFEVRQPTLKERSDLRKRCTSVTKDGMEFNLFEFLIWAVINHTFVPGTEEKVFSEDDYDGLIDLPAGGWFDELSEAASSLCNVGGDDAKKPSDETPKVKVSM